FDQPLDLSGFKAQKEDALYDAEATKLRKLAALESRAMADRNMTSVQYLPAKEAIHAEYEIATKGIEQEFAAMTKEMNMKAKSSSQPSGGGNSAPKGQGSAKGQGDAPKGDAPKSETPKPPAQKDTPPPSSASKDKPEDNMDTLSDFIKLSVGLNPPLDDHQKSTFNEETGYIIKENKDGSQTIINPKTGQRLLNATPDKIGIYARNYKHNYADKMKLLDGLADESVSAEDLEAFRSKLYDDRSYSDLGDIDSIKKSEIQKDNDLEQSSFIKKEIQKRKGGLPASNIGYAASILMPEITENTPSDSGNQFLADVTPGPGNVRSAYHFKDNVANANDSLEKGDYKAASIYAGLAMLDGMGTLPGGAPARLAKGAAARAGKTGAKAAADGLKNIATKAVPYKDARLAEKTLEALADTGGKTKKTLKGANVFNKEAWDKLTDAERKEIGDQLSKIIGNSGEEYLETFLKRMDPKAVGYSKLSKYKNASNSITPYTVHTPKGIRNYDGFARSVDDRIKDDKNTVERLLSLGKKEKVRSNPSAYELKTGKIGAGKGQKPKDDWLRETPGALEERNLKDIKNIRINPKNIPDKIVNKQANAVLDDLIKKGEIDPKVAKGLRNGGYSKAFKEELNAATGHLSAKDFDRILYRSLSHAVREYKEQNPY
ncbi:MAG: hypothetical protein GY795_25725, partial [Desulfobacterales bacterium]|nr:hypothetical protein [Desulfobacterales bacterium]